VAAALLVWGFISDDTTWLLVLAGVLVCTLYLVWGSIPRASTDPQERFSRNVQYMASFVLAGFVLLALNLLREQVVQADSTLDTQVVTETREVSPGLYEQDVTVTRGTTVMTSTSRFAGRGVQTGTRSTQDPREVQAGLRVQRGYIYNARGQELAGREIFPDNNFVRRTYPAPDASYLVGYYCPTIYGITGLEATFDDYLSGRTGRNPLLEQEERILHRPVVGNDVYVTIDPVIQSAATAALGQRKGGIVVLNAQTGAILASASYPHFDPTGLAFNPNDDWDAEFRRIQDYWGQVTSDPDNPLLLRATQGLYPPGSTFKTVTLAAALDMGKVRPDTVFTDTGSIVVEPGAPPDVDCSTCRPRGHGPRYTLMEGYQWSLNVVFAQLGTFIVGGDKLTEYARRFGFGNSYDDVGMAISTSRVAVDPDFLNSKKAVAGTSYGQGQMQSTVLQMALVAAAVAHGGEVPAPYIVEKVVDPTRNATVLAATPRNLGRAISPSTNATVKQMMNTSVE
jgi:peptidoglycan glycosyltransferase